MNDERSKLKNGVQEFSNLLKKPKVAGSALSLDVGGVIMETIIFNIAKKHIMEVAERGDLKAHNCDSEDFLEISVWCLEKALTAAYEQGKKDA